MHRRIGRALAGAMAAAVILSAAAAHAVDAPKWVAAIFIQAQKAVGLRWNPAAGATGYKVLRSTTQGSGYQEIGGGAQPQLIDSTVEPGTTYYYVLQALAGAEASPNSDEKTVAIPGEKKVEALKPPTWSKVVLTQTTEFGKTISKVGLFWTQPAGSPVAYNLYRSTVPGKDYQMLTSTSEMQYVDAAVEIGKTYYYVLTAIDQNFQETPQSPEQAMEVKEPEKKVETRAARKEKVQMILRRAKQVLTIKTGSFGELAQPTGIAVNSKGEIYVVDAGANKVFVFSPTGEFLFSFSERGEEPGQLNGPLDIAIDAEDRVYVTNNVPRIEIFDASGRPWKSVKLSELIPDGKVHISGGLECGSDAWYVSDEGTQLLLVMEYDTNKLLETLGSQGKELGQFLGPKKSYWSATKKLLAVPDMFNFRVQILRDNKAESVFGTYGNSVTQFSRVIDLAEDDKGDILAADFGNQTIQAFGWDGTFRYVVGTEDGANQISIAGVTGMVAKGKRLFLVEKPMARVTIYDLTDEIGPPGKKAPAGP